MFSTPQMYLESNLFIAAAIFCIGLMGVLWKRNAISVFMCVELMLNAANLAFASFARSLGLIDGSLIVLFVMTVAAAEAGVGLAIFVALFRARRSIQVDDLDSLSG